MCGTCGCTEAHRHDEEPDTETIVLERKVLAKNDELAARNRSALAARNILALNLVSSPGAGKTTLLESTIRRLRTERAVAVSEGDQETPLDAERIEATGAPVVQINTGAGCHLDAAMVHRAIDTLDPEPGALLLIENVGNLVCPGLFDLGEHGKVLITSVTEGTDKPLKYPHMFAVAELVIVNKIDLLPYVDFDLHTCVKYVRRINPGSTIIPMSATTGEGIEAWYEWIEARARQVCRQPMP